MRLTLTDYFDEVGSIEDIKSSYQIDGVTYSQNVFLELLLVLTYKLNEREEILDMSP